MTKSGSTTEMCRMTGIISVKSESGDFFFNELVSEETFDLEGMCVLSLSGADFIRHNQRFLSRIYPAGSRTSSSNYNPQEFWNIGSQLGELEKATLRLPKTGERTHDKGL